MTGPRGIAAIGLAAVLCAGCGRASHKQQAGQSGTAGTAGRTESGAMTVAPALPAGGPPGFLSPRPPGARPRALTKQFYQKRGEAAARIENPKTRPQKD